MSGGLKRWPAHGWVGASLVAIFWVLNWSLEGTRTSWCFFPLWLGYSLVVDAAAHVRRGSSLLTRDWRRYLLLFPLSALVWWMFELLNMRLENWSYLGRELFSDLHYAAFASLSFSTVMPAVFGTADLLTTLGPFRSGVGGGRGDGTGPDRGGQAADVPAGGRGKGVGGAAWRKQDTLLLVYGCVLLVALLVWPDLLFPLAWVAPLLILEGVGGYAGVRTLRSLVSEGRGGGVAALAVGALTCGFFWEMWNQYSFPKWIYHIPYADLLHVFEMPLAGYGGYLPFGPLLFSVASLVYGLKPRGGRGGRRDLLW